MTKMKIYDVTISFKKDGQVTEQLNKRYYSKDLDTLYSQVHTDYPKGNLLGGTCIRCVGTHYVSH